MRAVDESIPPIIGTACALALDARAAERACVPVDDRTLAAKGAAAAHLADASVLDRLGPNVLAVHLEQIERAEHRSGAGGMMANKARSGGGLLGAQAAPKLTP